MVTGFGTLECGGETIHCFLDDDREKCPKDGKHEWVERKNVRGEQDVYCKKCDMDYDELVMWM